MQHRESLPADPGGVSQRDDDEHRGYWERFYDSRSSAAVPSAPSPFAQWVAQFETPDAGLVDVGSGTGRDTLWFARQGYSCVGLDYADAAVRTGQRTADEAGLPVRFLQANLYDGAGMTAVGAAVSEKLSVEVVYARFLLHAIDDGARRILWDFAGALLPSGGRIYAEFRTEPTTHEFGEHYRHFVDPAIVISEVEARGWQVTRKLHGTGLAVYKNEDPQVCRLAIRR